MNDDNLAKSHHFVEFFGSSIRAELSRMYPVDGYVVTTLYRMGSHLVLKRELEDVGKDETRPHQRFDELLVSDFLVAFTERLNLDVRDVFEAAEVCVTADKTLIRLNRRQGR